MVDRAKGMPGLGEDVLLTFLAQTRDGKYVVLDKQLLSNLRATAHAVITNESEYYCSTS